MYNTSVGDFNKYHLEKLSDTELIEYAKLLIMDATEKEMEMNKNDTYNNSYNFASATQNVSAIIQHLNERNLIQSNFKFGVVDMCMYDAKNVGNLLKLFRS